MDSWNDKLNVLTEFVSRKLDERCNLRIQRLYWVLGDTMTSEPLFFKWNTTVRCVLCGHLTSQGFRLVQKNQFADMEDEYLRVKLCKDCVQQIQEAIQ